MEIEFTEIRDEVMVGRDGIPQIQKRYTFYIGKFGPFVERFPHNATPGDVTARIEQVRLTLQTLPR